MSSQIPERSKFDVAAYRFISGLARLVTRLYWRLEVVGSLSGAARRFVPRQRVPPRADVGRSHDRVAEPGEWPVRAKNPRRVATPPDGGL